MSIATRWRTGLTLIEVIIAVFVLAVGVLGAFALQATALSGSRNASELQELANVAASELEIQSEFRRSVGSAVLGGTCRTSGVLAGIGCVVDVYPCGASSSAITCTNANVTAVEAHQIVVRVTGVSGRSVQLSMVVKAL
jgi:prepilin-type N-terminal cleavage/methylation domain-containing protein